MWAGRGRRLMDTRSPRSAVLPDRIGEGLIMERSLGALLIAAMVAGAAAHAEVRQASFVVTAQVPPRATLQVVEQPALVEISEQDVARGYKDVAAHYQVESNTARGWLLRLAPRLGVAQQVEVRGLRSPVVLEDDAVEVHRPRALEPERLSLTYRFVLEPGTPPGSYQLPIHVSAAPL